LQSVRAADETMPPPVAGDVAKTTTVRFATSHSARKGVPTPAAVKPAALPQLIGAPQPMRAYSISQSNVTETSSDSTDTPAPSLVRQAPVHKATERVNRSVSIANCSDQKSCQTCATTTRCAHPCEKCCGNHSSCVNLLNILQWFEKNISCDACCQSTCTKAKQACGH
jgi:hypothetical protein